MLKYRDSDHSPANDMVTLLRKLVPGVQELRAQQEASTGVGCLRTTPAPATESEVSLLVQLGLAEPN